MDTALKICGGFAIACTALGIGLTIKEWIWESQCSWPGRCDKKWCRRSTTKTAQWTVRVEDFTRTAFVEGCDKHYDDLEEAQLDRLDEWAENMTLVLARARQPKLQRVL